MDYKEFLDKIRMIESSGGIDTDHETMQSGIHKGSSAYGQYGLMPNTIREFAKRVRMAKENNPDAISLEKSEDELIKQKLQENPELEQYFAQKVAEHVLKRQAGDEERAAYSWNQGHNLPSERITPEKLETSEYVKKFRNLKNMLAKD